MGFQTEYDFILPKGYSNLDGTLYREGKMRLATAADEIISFKDPRVRKDSSYLSVLLLTQVIIELGPFRQITPEIIGHLCQEDFDFLQELYQKINEIKS